MNDQRAIVVGICKASSPFQTFPVAQRAPTRRPWNSSRTNAIACRSCWLIPIRARASPTRAARFMPGRGCSPCRGSISSGTVGYYLRSTGIPVNFGITIGLGFIVGTAIAGQTF